MTPKEKAKELVEKFNDYTVKAIKYYANGKMEECKEDAKECALIAVDEILNDDWYIATREDLIAREEYWNEVKQELEKL